MLGSVVLPTMPAGGSCSTGREGSAGRPEAGEAEEGIAALRTFAGEMPASPTVRDCGVVTVSGGEVGGA